MDQKIEGENARIPRDKVEINIERYAQLLEVDLWSKIQSRLWALGGALLTVAALLSLFGIPIIVDNKIGNVFADRTKKFDETVDNYLSLYRTYFHVNSLVTQYRYHLNADILWIIGFLEAQGAKKTENDQEAKDQTRHMQELISSLRQVVSEGQATKILESQFIFQNFHLRTLADRDVDVPISEMVRTEITTLGGASASMSAHPLRNGKLSSLFADIQLRLILISSFEQALDELKQDVLSLGGGSQFDKKAKVLQVESQMQTKMVPGIVKRLGANFENHGILVTSRAKDSFEENRFMPLLKYYMKEAGFSLEDQKLSIKAKTIVVDPPPKPEKMGGPR